MPRLIVRGRIYRIGRKNKREIILVLNVSGADVKRRTRNEANNSSNENTMYIFVHKSLINTNVYEAMTTTINIRTDI